MADIKPVHHDEPGSDSSTDPTPPNHLGTEIPQGKFSGSHDPEKALHHDESTAPVSEKTEAALDDDDEDEDMDALIDDLESDDGQPADEEEVIEAGGARPVPEELLQTDTRFGLSDAEVLLRRKKFGLNQLKEEKENMILKFLSYFVGPIQFVMEVSVGQQFEQNLRAAEIIRCVAVLFLIRSVARLTVAMDPRLPRFWLPGWKTGWILASLSPC